MRCNAASSVRYCKESVCETECITAVTAVLPCMGEAECLVLFCAARCSTSMAS